MNKGPKRWEEDKVIKKILWVVRIRGMSHERCNLFIAT